MRSLWSAAAGGVTVLVMAVGMLATGSGLTSASAPAATTPRTITITGSGSVSATPDEATVTLGVTAQASDAQTALTHDSQQMNAVVTALEHTGIAAKDIQTSELQLNPQYPNGPSASHTITGFVATNTVQATVHDTSKLGNAIDAALQAGANTINGVNFSISNEAAVQNKAYQQAVADARSAAQAIASAAGVQISGIQSISESSNCCVRPVFAAAAVAAPASTPVFAGQQQVSVSLQVVFDIASWMTWPHLADAAAELAAAPPPWLRRFPFGASAARARARPKRPPARGARTAAGGFRAMAGAATGLGIVAVSLLHRAPAGHAAGPTDAPSTLIASSVQPRAALDAERQRLASQPCKPSPEYTPPGDGPTKVPAPAATW